MNETIENIDQHMNLETLIKRENGATDDKQKIDLPNQVNNTQHIEIKIEPIDYVEKKNNSESENYDCPTTIKVEPIENDSDVERHVVSNTPDEEYILPQKIKKRNPLKKSGNIKPGYKGKSRTHSNVIYSDEVIMHIEVVTITEEERQVEHRELLIGRRLMNFVCEWCPLGFVVEEAFQDHMKMHSPGNGGFECEVCHTWLKSPDVLYRHRLRHFRRYRCDLCGARMRDKDTVAAHIMCDHHGSAFHCTYCGSGFKRPQYLKKHVEQMHTRPAEYTCPVCKRVFYEKSWYRCHVRLHNDEVRKSVEQRAACSHCDRSFKNKAYLKRHLVTHEGGAAACSQCGRTFKNMESLRSHCRYQHGNKDLAKMRPRERECVACGRVCATASMLQRHFRRMHADRTKRFECDQCGRCYLTKGELRSHIMWSHLRRLGGHACACGRVFRTPARLRDHRARHHLRLPELRDKECHICGKAFASQQVLNRHVKGHSGERFPCSECGRTFKTQSYVKVHYKIKHMNMTRAQVKAESKRALHVLDDRAERTEARVKRSTRIDKDPLSVEEAVRVKRERELVAVDLAVPTFQTFVDIKCEFKT